MPKPPKTKLPKFKLRLNIAVFQAPMHHRQALINQLIQYVDEGWYPASTMSEVISYCADLLDPVKFIADLDSYRYESAAEGDVFDDFDMYHNNFRRLLYKIHRQFLLNDKVTSQYTLLPTMYTVM